MNKDDFEPFWQTFLAVIQAEETDVFECIYEFRDALNVWCEMLLQTSYFKCHG
jgi:hypothetical protein